MEDSSCFMQWDWSANTLDQHPFAAAASPVYATAGSLDGGSILAAAFPSQQALCSAPQSQSTAGDIPGLTVQIDHQYRVSSPGDAVDHAPVSRASRPMSWKFIATSMQPTDISLPAMRGGHTPAAGSSVKGSAAAAAVSMCPDPGKGHIIANRRRREKINQRPHQ